MQSTATEEITLVCEEPVALNATASDFTEFWFVVPPTSFEQGFTVTVTDALGGVFSQTTSKPVTISRNSLSRMASMEVVPDYDHAFVPFKDANFKAYCVQNFDKNGDGEISITEASNITEIFVVSTEYIEFESLEGIEFMPNLKTLSCCGQSSSKKGKLTSLDVSKNIVLWNLSCDNNQLTSLDVSKNTTLTWLVCSLNPYLTTIWLKKGQTFDFFQYDANVATIKYKDESDQSQHEAIDLGLPSGLKWATCNVGANTPEEYGDYFAWGETRPYYIEGHSQDDPCSNWIDGKTGYNWESYKFRISGDSHQDVTFNKYNANSNHGIVDNRTLLEFSDDAARVNWGGEWRMPTDAEWAELRSQCNWQWTAQNGKYGYLVTGPNGNSVFLPAAGDRDLTSFLNVGSWGQYWSSSCKTDDPYFAYSVAFYSGGVRKEGNGRCLGYTVRPVYGDPVTVSSVSLDRAMISLAEGKSTQLVADVLPENAGEMGVTWSSNNPSVASVRTSGLVSANQVGNAVITVTTIDGGLEATCQVTVNAPNPPEYVDLGLSVKWATFNVGANSPAEYGDYFAWGETNLKNEYTWKNYKYANGANNRLTKYCNNSSYGDEGFTDTLVELQAEDDVARVNWGGNWRMPTSEEVTELRTKCDWLWTTQDGSNGYRVTGPNGNSIFLPAAGWQFSTSSRNSGSRGD